MKKMIAYTIVSIAIIGELVTEHSIETNRENYSLVDRNHSDRTKSS